MTDSGPRARIEWHGDFVGDGSLARVNRLLAGALISSGAVDVVPHGEPLANLSSVLPSGTNVRGVSAGLPSIMLRHRWPPRFMNPSRVHYVHMQPWEFGSVPRAWVERLAARADDVWCYSHHVLRGYAEAGLSPERLHVIPLGFDPTVYHPGVEAIPTDNPDACIFLFVGALIPRKNVAKVVEAYTRAFSVGDPVALLIKTDPSLGMYDDGGLAEQLRNLQSVSTIPPIRLIEGRFDDTDMARFYRMATALVQPYRGEGFGLPMLEAMACGVPVVVTGGGSTDDFVDDSVGYVLPAERVSLGNAVEGVELAGEGWWLEASTDALVDAMRRIASDRTAAIAKGQTAAIRAHAGWTWTHAAQKVVDRLATVLGRDVRSSQNAPADELRAYAWQGFSRQGVDGMLIELFARIGVGHPFFVEIGAGSGEHASARLLATRYGWPGLMLEADATCFESLQAVYEQIPAVRTLPLAASATDVVGVMQEYGVPQAFDLLSIDRGDASEVWEAMASYAPRVVLLMGDHANMRAHAVLGSTLGYALVALDSSETCRVFLRRELLAGSAFSEHAL